MVPTELWMVVDRIDDPSTQQINSLLFPTLVGLVVIRHARQVKHGANNLYSSEPRITRSRPKNFKRTIEN